VRSTVRSGQRRPGAERAIVKEISILFDYEQEHTILYRGWLKDMDVELLPTEPKTITTAIGRTVESRQIAIIPLQHPKKEGEPVVIGAWVVELEGRPRRSRT
jgi:hypothetical protein